MSVSSYFVMYWLASLVAREVLYPYRNYKNRIEVVSKIYAID
jgi:hypothetical protein